MARGLLDPLADAGGVDEAPGAAAELDQLVDRVDGGAGDVVDDDALVAGELVEQRGLADVGLADDRDPARSADLARRCSGGGSGSAARTASSMSPEPRPCSAETGYGSPSPRFHSAVGLGLGALVVDLVGGQHDRLAGLAQDLDDGLVDVGDADGRVDHEQHGVGERHRDLGLGGDPLGQPAGVGVPAAGVDDGEGAAVPDGVVRDPVAGHAGDVLDDGLAAADDAVDQGRLADVGAADDGQHGHRAGRRSVRVELVVRLAHVGDLGVGVSGSGPSAAGIGPGSARPVSVLGVGEVGEQVLAQRERRLLDVLLACAATACASNVYGAPKTRSTCPPCVGSALLAGARLAGAELDHGHDRARRRPAPR